MVDATHQKKNLFCIIEDAMQKCRIMHRPSQPLAKACASGCIDLRKRLHFFAVYENVFFSFQTALEECKYALN